MEADVVKSVGWLLVVLVWVGAGIAARSGGGPEVAPVATSFCPYCGAETTTPVACLACERSLEWARREIDALFPSSRSTG
jgi:hypothetical protein